MSRETMTIKCNAARFGKGRTQLGIFARRGSPDLGALCGVLLGGVAEGVKHRMRVNEMSAPGFA